MRRYTQSLFISLFCHAMHSSGHRSLCNNSHDNGRIISSYPAPYVNQLVHDYLEHIKTSYSTMEIGRMIY